VNNHLRKVKFNFYHQNLIQNQIQNQTDHQLNKIQKKMKIFIVLLKKIHLHLKKQKTNQSNLS